MKAFLSYALSLGGLGLVIAAVLGAYASNLSYPAARLRMIQMLRTSVNQAEVMCRAAKGTFYEAIGSAIKIGAMTMTGIALRIAANRSTSPRIGGNTKVVAAAAIEMRLPRAKPRNAPTSVVLKALNRIEARAGSPT